MHASEPAPELVREAVQRRAAAHAHARRVRNVGEQQRHLCLLCRAAARRVHHDDVHAVPPHGAAWRLRVQDHVHGLDAALQVVQRHQLHRLYQLAPPRLVAHQPALGGGDSEEVRAWVHGHVAEHRLAVRVAHATGVVNAIEGDLAAVVDDFMEPGGWGHMMHRCRASAARQQRQIHLMGHHGRTARRARHPGAPLLMRPPEQPKARQAHVVVARPQPARRRRLNVVRLQTDAAYFVQVSSSFSLLFLLSLTSSSFLSFFRFNHQIAA